MRICFLLGGVQTNGGIGRVTSVLTNRLCTDSSLEITILAYAHENKPSLYKFDEKICFESLFDRQTSMLKAVILHGAVRKTRKLLQKKKIDILIACGALFFPLGINACKRTKTKCFCWEHTNPAAASDHKFQNWCRRYAVKHCNKLIVLTKEAQAYYLDVLKMDSKRLCQIYNPVDVGARRSKRYDVTSKKIISVGRICYQKNFERLVEIAKHVLPYYPDWSWDIYGEGSMLNEIQVKINEVGLQGQIFLRGQVDDLYERYRQYSFMVMTSRYEGFPMSLIEGLINRLPLVCFDVPTGPQEIITKENGFLIEKGDDIGMIRTIHTLIENPPLRKTLSDNAYSSAFRFTIDEIIMRWKKCFEQ